MPENKFFNNFSPTSTREWVDRITKDLKGADFNKKLVWRTNEGFEVQPFYRQENLAGKQFLDSWPGDFPYVRGNKKDNTWFIRQDITVSDAAAANKIALDILNKGVDSLGFILAKKEFSKAELEMLLKNICLDCVEINFEKVHDPIVLLKNVKHIVQEKGVSPEKITGGIAIDPLSYFSLRGTFEQTEEDTFDQLKKIAEEAKSLPGFKIIAVGGTIFNNSGSSIVEELAFSLAAGVEYLVQLTRRGLSIDEAAPKMRFHFATGSKYFMEIAKLRAARLLWAPIVKKFNPSKDAVCKMNIHAETSGWNKTLYDPYVNMLRTQTEAMSSILGGLDSFTVKPFNEAYESSTEFSERIARSQQLLLKEEAYFDKVSDPAAGSYYIESLTELIAGEAWKLFLQVQEQGGYLVAFKKGFVQATIKATAQKRDMAIATRREILLGTNQFPNFNEHLDKELNAGVFEPKCLTANNAVHETLKTYRGGQAFEALRYKTDMHAKKGCRPKVLMFPVGDLNMRKIRVQFACNFFACAGFEVVDNSGFNTIEEGVNACVKNKADIVVICSSDDEYATLAPEIFKSLKDKAIVVIAGTPACADELKAKGMDNFISIRSNVLETLRQYQLRLGIE